MDYVDLEDFIKLNSDPGWPYGGDEEKILELNPRKNIPSPLPESIEPDDENVESFLKRFAISSVTGNTDLDDQEEPNFEKHEILEPNFDDNYTDKPEVLEPDFDSLPTIEILEPDFDNILGADENDGQTLNHVNDLVKKFKERKNKAT
jgi:hypothetical protein